MSLILPKVVGSIDVMARARKDLLIVKRLGVISNGTDEEATQSYSENLKANHMRLYGGS